MENNRKVSVIIRFLAAACAMFVAVFACGCTLFNKKEEGGEKNIRTDYPQYESVIDREIVLPAEDDAQGNIDLAYYLYITANAAFQNCSACAYTVDSVTTSTVGFGPLKIDIPVQGCRFFLKTGDEYYYTEYSYVEEGMEGMISTFSKKEKSLFAMRKYGSVERKSAYTEKVFDSVVEIDDDGQFIVEADWSEGNRISGYPKEEELVPFCSKINAKYEQTDQKITPETIKSARVTHNDDEGYYTVTMSLDVENTLTSQNTLANLQDGLDNAKYVSIEETVEIWDNGYYKSFLSVDTASNGLITLTIDFKTYFHYGEKYLQPENYAYFVETKEAATK